jgi:TPP-dependent pyruvate/acetoin dehydrogenase alpha subunit
MTPQQEDNTMEKKGFKKTSKTGLTDSDLISIYRLMVLTREFETKIMQIYSQQGIPELPHLCIGEEAVGVGSCYGLRVDDYVLPTLRGRSIFLAKGVSPSILMAGVYGKATGPSKGKWTAHHMGDLEKGILAGSLIIGSQFPTAVGAGLAFKIKKTDQVCLCYFGDGASNRGDFHEGLNIAAVFKLPVIFICNNNRYAIDTPVEKAMLIKNIALRARGYGVPGKTIDGNDVLKVYHTVQEAVERARDGGGPTLIECKTYRLRPHCERYPEDRPKEELNDWWEKCPIKRFKASLLKKGIFDEKRDHEIVQEVKEEINQAVAFADQSPFPQPEEIFEDVYAHGTIRGGRLCMR